MTFRGESLRKILGAIEDAVAFRPAKESDDDDEEETRIILIGHSAGGWIARLFLGGKSIKYDGKLYEGYKAKTVAALVTLGTPHNSAEAYPFGRVKEVRTREKSSIKIETKVNLFLVCWQDGIHKKIITIFLRLYIV